MIAFAGLVERLVFTGGRDARVTLLRRFCETQPDPERGYALGVLTGALRVPNLRPAALRALAMERCDPALFDWSHAFVGDLTETVALIWPQAGRNAPPPGVAEILATPRPAFPAMLAGWLDASDANVRLALLKLLTGGMRTLIGGAEIRLALAAMAGLPVAEVEVVWHGQKPPFQPLFAWLDGRGPRPANGGFLPFMLPGEAGPGDWVAERFWQGERVLLADGRVFSRAADDVSSAYPEYCLSGVVLDGVVTREPRCLRLCDMLFEGSEDLRALGFTERRVRLGGWFERIRPDGMALSPLVPFGDGDMGLMLKRRDSPYVAGSDHGHWVARRHVRRTVAATLLYAEGDSYTVGLRRDGTLVPVGRAAARDAGALEVWVRDHTVARHGPVREVEKTLVLSVSFGSVRDAPRRKAGIILEDARIDAILTGGGADDLDVLGRGV